MPKQTLILSDGLDPVRVTGAVDVLLNYSDLDIVCEPIPPMSAWNRYRYLRSRKSLAAPSLLKGYRLAGDSLIEVSCPVDDQVLAGLKVNSIRPYIFKPKAAKALVVQNGPDGCRHTLFSQHNPIYTRLTESGPEQIKATLDYAKSHFQLDGIEIEFIEQGTPLPITFHLPAVVRQARMAQQQKYFSDFAKVTVAGLMVLATWQFYGMQRLQHKHASLDTQHSELASNFASLRQHLLLDKMLPASHKQQLEEPSPIDLLRHIGQVMGKELLISAFKWQSNAQEERLLIQVKVSAEDDLDQKVDVVEDFRHHLQQALPKFTVTMQSLPHGSSAQETFSGSTNPQDLLLEGDKDKAIIQLVRRKSS